MGAKTVVLTTGGGGRLYSGTTNAYACTGDGMTMALRAGVALEDMEMMQFHPTTLAPTGVMIAEGARGEGAYLLNAERERFLKRYAPNAMELASRDVISRAEQTEIDEGRGVEGNVLLDMRHLGAERIIERLHGTRELAMTYAGVDPIHEPIPVRPGAHYHMGGVDTDLDGRTDLEGLYAAGASATSASLSTTRATSSTTTSPRPWSLASCSSWPSAWWSAGSPAKRAAAPTRARTTTRTATMRITSSTRSFAGSPRLQFSTGSP